jgi:orotidine-5'-phosphate decarboxylase
MTDVTASDVDASVRGRLALALDVDDLVAAVRLARRLAPWFGTAKVGLELFSAVGPDSVGALTDLGYDVFLDLKLHDIPTTVERAAKVLGSLGARYLNFHGQGGLTMMRAGVEGFKAGADDAGLPPPLALAVTILTSSADAPVDLLSRRVADAIEADCDGVVCAASDVRSVKRLGPRLVAVVPGIRPAGTGVHDQARTATPAEAIGEGADLLVLGRAVTAAQDPSAAAAAVAAEVAAAMV